MSYKKLISTSKRHVEHPFAGQNTQQTEKDKKRIKKIKKRNKNFEERKIEKKDILKINEL